MKNSRLSILTFCSLIFFILSLSAVCNTLPLPPNLDEKIEVCLEKNQVQEISNEKKDSANYFLTKRTHKVFSNDESLELFTVRNVLLTPEDFYSRFIKKPEPVFESYSYDVRLKAFILIWFDAYFSTGPDNQTVSLANFDIFENKGISYSRLFLLLDEIPRKEGDPGFKFNWKHPTVLGIVTHLDLVAQSYFFNFVLSAE